MPWVRIYGVLMMVTAAMCGFVSPAAAADTVIYELRGAVDALFRLG